MLVQIEKRFAEYHSQQQKKIRKEKNDNVFNLESTSNFRRLAAFPTLHNNTK
jgi:hypothetical protein